MKSMVILINTALMLLRRSVWRNSMKSKWDVILKLLARNKKEKSFFKFMLDYLDSSNI
jgi:hypothetical protein